MPPGQVNNFTCVAPEEGGTGQENPRGAFLSNDFRNTRRTHRIWKALFAQRPLPADRR